MSRRGIGRGLAAILPETAAEEPELRDLPLELIRPNPEQPRTRFDPASITSLADSIADAGMVQPLIVRPLPDGRYELIAGERRWRAAREAGVRDSSGDRPRRGRRRERLQTALIENVAREDLNPVDEARACAALVEDLGLSKEELARRLGRSRSAISNLIRLLDLPDEVLELLAAGELSEGHGRAILQVHGNDARRSLAREAAARGWSVRETERHAKGIDEPGGSEARPPPGPGSGALPRGGDARAGARHRRPRPRGPPRDSGRAAVRRPGRAARVRTRDPPGLARVRAPAAGSPRRPRRGCRRSDRAGGRPGPARTRSARAARRNPPQNSGRGMSSPANLSPASVTRASRVPRSAIGWLCGDAHAPIRASRDRLEKYALSSAAGSFSTPPRILT